jgi:gluconokinase
MDVVLGLDVGTTSAKAVAFDAEGHTRGAGEHGYELHTPEPGQEEQDPAEVLAGALAAVRDAAGAVRAAGAEVRAVAVSSAMHSLVALGADGRPATSLITWADTRAAAEAEMLKAEHPDLQGRTGTPLHPMSPLPKLLWLRRHRPDVFAAAARWAGIKELCLETLTGRFCLDHSVASGTGLFALEPRDWDDEALAVAEVRREQLAELLDGGEVAGGLTSEAAAATGLEPGTPVVAGGGDGPLANLGVGAVHPGVAACSIGTSGALRLVVERPVVDPEGRVFCYALAPGRWVVGGAINNGGSVLRWTGDALAPDLGREPEAALLELAAAVPAGSDGLVMLPYLLSERAPHWSATPRGAYVGLTQAHGRGHLVRAALEGVCQQLALVLASLRETGNEVRAVRATGGFARSPLWRQMLADALGMAIEFPEGHEGSAFGAALIGMCTLGLTSSLERAAELIRIEDVVAPDPESAARYAAALPIFAALYDELGPAFGRLATLTA